MNVTASVATRSGKLNGEAAKEPTAKDGAPRDWCRPNCGLDFKYNQARRSRKGVRLPTYVSQTSFASAISISFSGYGTQGNPYG